MEIVRHDVPAWPPEPFIYAAADLRKRLGIRLSSVNCLTQDGNAYGKRIYPVMLVSESAAEASIPAPLNSGSGVPSGVPAALSMESPIPETPARQTAGRPINIVSVISLVAGILGLLLICPSILFPFFPVLCEGLLGLAAVVTGLIGINETKKSRERGREMAFAGLVTGVFSLLAACAIGVIFALGLAVTLYGTPTPMPFQ